MNGTAVKHCIKCGYQMKYLGRIEQPIIGEPSVTAHIITDTYTCENQACEIYGLVVVA